MKWCFHSILCVPIYFNELFLLIYFIKTQLTHSFSCTESSANYQNPSFSFGKGKEIREFTVSIYSRGARLGKSAQCAFNYSLLYARVRKKLDRRAAKGVMDRRLMISDRRVRARGNWATAAAAAFFRLEKLRVRFVYAERRSESRRA